MSATPAAGPGTGQAAVLPSVSLVMVMKNERRHLEAGYEVVARQDYPAPVEVVYVDSGSTDGTIEFMRARGVEPICIPPTEFHHGRTRNLAARHSKNEILVFLSGDATPTNNHWLRNLVAPFEDPRVGAVYGRQIAPANIGPLRAHAIAQEYPEARTVRDLSQTAQIHPGLFRFSNANSAVRRTVWERFPFNETLVLAEDQGLCRDVLMAGMKVVYEPEAAVIHGHERTVWGEFRFAFENGVSLTRMGILRNPAVGGEFGYGLRRVRSDLAHYVSQRQFGYAAKSFAINAVKWFGVQVGKREAMLPAGLTRQISPGMARAPQPTPKCGTGDSSRTP